MKRSARISIAACAIAAGAALTVYSGISLASSPIFSASAQTDSKNQILNGKVVWNNNITIPPEVTVTVDKDASLYITDDTLVTLNGTLVICPGGSLYVRGTLISEADSVIMNSGKIKILSMGSISLSGKCKISDCSEIKGKGKLYVNNLFSDISCEGSVTCNIVPPEPVTADGVTTVGGVLLVNRQYHLPKSYGSGIDHDAYSALLRMRGASGYDMTIISGYRSYETQMKTFEYWAMLDGYERASQYSAQPGESEHQTGLAIDITSTETEYENTDEGKWLAANCYKYGFIIRYPADSMDITGYIYEPWHIRYLGESTARLVYFSGLTLEEFLGVYEK